VWEDEFVHDCPFSIVKTIQLETIGRALMNRKVNKYFELLENITICNNILAWKTAEGFYLTQNDEALSQQKATDEIKIIDNLILSEMDYHSINLLQTITSLTRQTNDKICQVYRTFMNMYKKWRMSSSLLTILMVIKQFCIQTKVKFSFQIESKFQKLKILKIQKNVMKIFQH
jgi:hypothetical protein